jgi:nitrite reductase (NADH) large subunit
MRTSCENVFAAGDVAEVEDFLTRKRTVHAIWPTAVEQGRIAGANMAGGDVGYAGSLGMHVVELFGVTVAQVGRFREGPDDTGRRLGSSGHSRYRKVVLDGDGRLVGWVYVGDARGVAEAGVVHGLVRKHALWEGLAHHRFPTLTYATSVRPAGSP